MRILVVEQHPDTRSFVDELRAYGYDVTYVETVPDAYEVIRAFKPEMLFVGQHLEGEEGMVMIEEFARGLAPIVFMARESNQQERVLSLKLGADMVLGWPVDQRLLEAKMHAIQRGYERGVIHPEVIKYGQLTCWPAKRIVHIDDKLVHLTRTEYIVLHLFLKRPEGLISRDQFSMSIWGTQTIGHTLDVHIGRLRVKLEAAGMEDPQIVAIRGHGWRLMATGRNSKEDLS